MSRRALRPVVAVTLVAGCTIVDPITVSAVEQDAFNRLALNHRRDVADEASRIAVIHRVGEAYTEDAWEVGPWLSRRQQRGVPTEAPATWTFRTDDSFNDYHGEDEGYTLDGVTVEARWDAEHRLSMDVTGRMVPGGLTAAFGLEPFVVTWTVRDASDPVAVGRQGRTTLTTTARWTDRCGLGWSHSWTDVIRIDRPPAQAYYQVASSDPTRAVREDGMQASSFPRARAAARCP